MNKEVVSQNLCSGCQLCKYMCPKNAIELVENEEGFMLPIKNDNCIECGLCEKKCPMNNDLKFKTMEQKAYTCNYKDDDILEKSSSGGAFTAITQVFCDTNYIIFGAKYDKNNEVEHGYIDNIKDIDVFRKSKYVQSNVKDSYVKAKKFLEEGKKVLFSGTPCQIAALKNYLKREYENLLCVDIICHGAPSPKVFRKYKNFWESKYKNKIKNIEFRKKTYKNNKRDSQNICLQFENGKLIIRNKKNDLYLRCFYTQMIYRKACSTCKFASPTRYSDITLGDSWGIEKIYPDLDVHKGESVVIVNTDKGRNLFNDMNKYMNIKDIDVNFVIKENSQFREPTKFNNRRNEFFKELDNMPFDKLVDKYCGIKFFTKVKRKIKRILHEKGEKKDGKRKKI